VWRLWLVVLALASMPIVVQRASFGYRPTVATGFIGDTFVIGEKDGKKTLTIRDWQHEYVFVEATKKK
jgi:hypothetical protein